MGDRARVESGRRSDWCEMRRLAAARAAKMFPQEPERPAPPAKPPKVKRTLPEQQREYRAAKHARHKARAAAQVSLQATIASIVARNHGRPVQGPMQAALARLSAAVPGRRHEIHDSDEE